MNRTDWRILFSAIGIVILSILIVINLRSGFQDNKVDVMRAEKDNEMERLCLDYGFDTLYVYDNIEPPIYYCVELPAVGELGIVVRIPEGINSTPPTPAPVEPIQPTGQEKSWEVGQ